MSDGHEPHTLVGAEPALNPDWVARMQRNAIPILERPKMEDHGREPRREIPAPAITQSKPTIPGSSLEDEEYREYRYPDGQGGMQTVTIRNPTRLHVGKTTHRILGSDGLVRCVPAPGQLGCYLVWKPKDISNWCQF